MTNQVEFGEALSFGWSRFKGNVGFHLIAFLVIVLGASLTFGLLAGPLMVGYIRAVVKAENGQAPAVGELFGAFDKFVPSLILFVVFIVVSMVPFGSLLVSPLYFIGLYLIAEGENDGMNAIKRAWEVYQANLVPALVGFFVVSLVASLGILLCCVGMFATVPLSMIANVRLAQQVLGRAPNGAAPTQTPAMY